MNKKITIKSFVGNLLFIAFVLLIVNRFLSVTSQVPFPINIVSENSMNPYLMEGDLVAWVPTNIEDVEEGDVIVFQSRIHWPEEKLVVHRVERSFEKNNIIFLATKGDANEWTDQRGPHIPEPYITKENFIGKTISVGKMPLKFPFIGIIGIWVNEGLNALSQPSASKGTMTYLGVFTPLTVAIILLIISLFMLPEKVKTAKEKIRKYIFGSRGVAVIHTILFFLVIYIFLFSFIHVFAYDTTVASVGVGEFPDEAEFQLGTVEPGQTGFPHALPLVNPGIMPVKGFIFGTDELTSLIDRRTFMMHPGEFTDVEVTASVPEGTADGSYVADVKVYSSPLWFIFPENVMEFCYSFDPSWAVYLLDFLAASVFTSITLGLMIIGEYSERFYRQIEINRCWQKTPKLVIVGEIRIRLQKFRMKIRRMLIDRFRWITAINVTDVDKKPLFMVVPMLVLSFILFESEVLAVLIASVTVGLFSYTISCKTRQKIVLSSFLVFLVGYAFIAGKTNLLILTQQRPLIEALGLIVGSLGVYLLMISLLVVPLCLAGWWLVYKLRNLKEHKDPLLVLEGQCDL